MATAKTDSGEGAGRRRGPTTVAREYFDAVSAHDLDAAVALWEHGGIDRLVGVGEFRVPEGFKQWFGGLFAAFPDFSFEVISITAQKEHAAVRWRATGTFDGTGRFEGIDPNGARIEVEGCDVLTVRDGRIVENHAYMNGTDLARQIGALPPRGSAAERGMLGALNAKTRASALIRDLRNR